MSIPRHAMNTLLPVLSCRRHPCSGLSSEYPPPWRGVFMTIAEHPRGFSVHFACWDSLFCTEKQVNGVDIVVFLFLWESCLLFLWLRTIYVLKSLEVESQRCRCYRSKNCSLHNLTQRTQVSRSACTIQLWLQGVNRSTVLFSAFEQHPPHTHTHRPWRGAEGLLAEAVVAWQCQMDEKHVLQTKVLSFK